MSSFLDIFGFLSVILRGLILIAQSLTLGGIGFTVLLWQPLSSRLSTESSEIGRRCRIILANSSIAFAVFTLSTLIVNAAVLAGTLDLPWRDTLDADFARADIAIAGAALCIGLLSCGRESRWRTAALISFAVAALAGQLSLTHAVSRPGLRWPYLLADALHMTGTAVWIGGLPYFLLALGLSRDGADCGVIGRRYSAMSLTSVTVIIGSGMLMAFGYIGAPEAIYGTAYGVMVMTKIALLLMLLGLGGANYLTVEKLWRDPSTSILRLKRFAEAEIGIGLTVLLAAASLTSLPPAIDLVQDRVTWPEIVERFSPQWPRLTSPSSDQLTINQLQAQIAEADARRIPEPRAYVPGEGIILPRNAEDVAWSEYNHHWAGIFVMLIGVLALIQHSRWGRWTRHWPLLFIPLAAFLFFRADEEAWPIGQIGFFESMRDVEVAQHRIFELLIVLFAVFEWRVQTSPKKDQRATLAFPLLVAIGGAMLLAHSHAIANIKDQLLIEMSHAPIAICGIIAGWARWIELRLDGTPSRIASRLWPAALVLVGLILLDYREA